MAELLDPSTSKDLLTSLEYLRLVAMDDKGMVIEGAQTVFERDSYKSRRHRFAQRWLCKTLGAKAVIDTEKLLQRSAKRLNAARANGFNPADD